MEVLEVLRPVSFGERVAEEEIDRLADYFVETDHWHRLISDQADIVYGAKGAGKSALYALLSAKSSELFDQGVILAAAENPRGSTAFKSLVGDPPLSEREFMALWKLYLACLISETLEDYGIPSESAKKLRTILEGDGLIPREKTLKALLLSTFDYVKRLTRPSAVEGGLKLDPATNLPVGLTCKVIFSEPSAVQSAQGMTSVDHLLELADEALTDSNYKIWVLLDRLDVAFTDSIDLETSALRALFHVYLDTLAYKSIRLKIFLRTDIWHRITTEGFREASHITRHLTIEWNNASLLNLIVRRAAQNESILRFFQLTRDDILSSAEKQNQFFYQVFPDQVEAGLRKSNTLDWLIGRSCDGSKLAAPRELIHLLNSLRNVQVRRLELKEADPDGGRLFARAAFKEALPEVSNTRLQQTLYAEYPLVRPYVEKMRREKTQHTLETLAAIWGSSVETASETARLLTEIGFFERRGDKESPVFWIPFLYRDALELVQGAAD